MRAEIAKARYLPLPRWSAAVIVLIAAIGGGSPFLFRPTDPDTYVAVPGTVLAITMSVVTLLIGVWIVTVEFASGTLQRTLTAEPDRNRVLAAKLVVALLVSGVISIAAAATAGGLANLAAVENGVDIDTGELARQTFGSIPGALFAVFVGFGFGLLTRSTGGGITLGLGFTFVLSGALTFVPSVLRWSFNQLTQDLTNHLVGEGHTLNGLGASIVGVIVWLVVLVVPGWVAFVRGDLK